MPKSSLETIDRRRRNVRGRQGCSRGYNARHPPPGEAHRTCASWMTTVVGSTATGRQDATAIISTTMPDILPRKLPAASATRPKLLVFGAWALARRSDEQESRLLDAPAMQCLGIGIYSRCRGTAVHAIQMLPVLRSLLSNRFITPLSVDAVLSSPNSSMLFDETAKYFDLSEWHMVERYSHVPPGLLPNGLCHAIVQTKRDLQVCRACLVHSALFGTCRCGIIADTPVNAWPSVDGLAQPC